MSAPFAFGAAPATDAAPTAELNAAATAQTSAPAAATAPFTFAPAPSSPFSFASDPAPSSPFHFTPPSAVTNPFVTGSSFGSSTAAPASGSVLSPSLAVAFNTGALPLPPSGCTINSDKLVRLEREYAEHKRQSEASLLILQRQLQESQAAREADVAQLRRTLEGAAASQTTQVQRWREENTHVNKHLSLLLSKERVAHAQSQGQLAEMELRVCRLTSERDQARAQLEQLQKAHEQGVKPAVQLARRCVLTQQSVTTLALVCRCLDAHSLLSAYQSCRTLKAAASHPLTFQHAIGVRVPRMKPVEILGPGATFSDPSKFELALQSPLMRHCRNLTLIAFEVPSLLTLLESLHAHCPPLHSLTLDVSGVNDWSTPFTTLEEIESQRELSGAADTAAMEAHPRYFMESPARWGAVHSPYVFRMLSLGANRNLGFLRVLCIRFGSELDNCALLAHLPRSLELLQLQTTNATIALPSGLPQWLQPLSRMRRLIVSTASPPGSMGGFVDLVRVVDHLGILSELNRVAPQVMIHYLLPIDLISDRFERASYQALAVAHIDELVCTLLPLQVQEHVDSNALQALALFPSLTALSFTDVARYRGDFDLVCWPASVASQLQELTIQGQDIDFVAVFEQLAAASMVRLHTLEVTDCFRLPELAWTDALELLQSMPSLQHLSVSLLCIESLNVLQLVPRLMTLKGLVWPYKSSIGSTVLEKHPMDAAPLCPALRFLAVALAPGERNALRALPLLQRLFPALQSVQWCDAPIRSIAQLTAQTAEISHKAAEVSTIQVQRQQKRLQRDTVYKSLFDRLISARFSLSALEQAQYWYVAGTLVTDVEDNEAIMIEALKGLATRVEATYGRQPSARSSNISDSRSSCAVSSTAPAFALTLGDDASDSFVSSLTAAPSSTSGSVSSSSSTRSKPKKASGSNRHAKSHGAGSSSKAAVASGFTSFVAASAPASSGRAFPVNPFAVTTAAAPADGSPFSFSLGGSALPPHAAAPSNPFAFALPPSASSVSAVSSAAAAADPNSQS